MKCCMLIGIQRMNDFYCEKPKKKCTRRAAEFLKLIFSFMDKIREPMYIEK
jgi:hypothetical protein